MRHLLFPASVIAVVIALALIIFFDDDASAPALHDAARDTPATNAVPLAEPSGPASPERIASPAAAALGEDRTALESGVYRESVPLARVVGTVTDSNERAVAGLAIELTSVDGAWREGTTVPNIVRGSWTSPGWRSHTDESGRFSFDVPVPTSDWVSLYANSDPMLGIIGRDFGPAGGRDEPRLVEGENDLGTIVAPVAGGLEGRVIDETGAPIEGAEVRLDGSHPGGFGVVATTGAHGRYRIGHLRVGPARLEVHADGFLGALADAPQDVRLREVLPGPDFSLSRAPSISGVVVDQSGAAVERVWVQGWPTGGGTGASAWSGADGRFVMDLPQDERYSLVIDRDPRFRTWGGQGVGKATFDPGENGVRIELERVERMTVAVVDARTGEPVERFAIFAGAVGGYQVEHLLEGGSFPDGRLELFAAPGPNQKLYVRASGYVPFESEIGYDVADAALQTVRLEVGASIAGCVRFQGRPMQGAMVVVNPRRLPKDPAVAVDPDDWWGDSWVYDVAAEADHERAIGSDAAGRFVVNDLAPGNYRLEIVSADTAPYNLESIVLEAREARELGDIALEHGASLHCTVRLPGAESPVGLVFDASAGYRTDGEIESADGSFLVTGLPAGEHSIEVSADGWRVLENQIRSFRVGPGETHELLIDLSTSLTAQVSVRVSSKGQAVVGVKVQLDVVDSDGGLIEGATSTKIGSTDVDGRAAGPAPSGRFVRASAHDGARWLGFGEPFELLPGAERHADLELEIGRLRLTFPEEIELPKRAEFHLIFRRTVAAGTRERRWMHANGKRSGGRIGLFDVAWESSIAPIGYLRAGHYEMKIDVWERIDEEPGLRSMLEGLTREFDVAIGEETVIDIPLN